MVYFYLPSNLVHMYSDNISGKLRFFSVNQLQNNDISGKKEKVAYCLLTYERFKFNCFVLFLLNASN